MTRILAIAALVWAAALPAQTRAVATAANPTNCRACHTKETPSKNDPALLACPRLKVKGYHATDEAPASMVIGRKDAKYAPVKFKHREHAHMAETGAGCVGCHHYDQARPIQKCKNCHAVARVREDLSKPDLKAAMHRQCLDCHRDWNPTGTCQSCHEKADTKGAPPKFDPGKSGEKKKPTTVSAPDRVIYETGAKEGKMVTFFHTDHTKRFALACADCHQGESCRGCHDRKRVGSDNEVINRKSQKGLSEEEAHVRCANCHDINECQVCHKGMSPRTIGFDHARRAGFALNMFHSPLECRSCHKSPGAYTKLAADCESCHKGWQKKFEHARAGVQLDEQHGDLDCTDCHTDKVFSAKPSCAGCHDDKTWPAQKPGKIVPKDSTVKSAAKAAAKATAKDTTAKPAGAKEAPAKPATARDTIGKKGK